MTLTPRKALLTLALLTPLPLWAMAQTAAPGTSAQPVTAQPVTPSAPVSVPVSVPVTVSVPVSVPAAAPTAQPVPVQAAPSVPSSGPVTVPMSVPMSVPVPMPAPLSVPLSVPVSVPVAAPLPAAAPSVPQAAPTGPNGSAPSSGSALRGLWVDAFGPGLFTPAQVQATVDGAARMGVNALFVQAIRRQDCLCRSSTLPVASGVQAGFDPLATVVRLAHARGIRVIGWVSVTGAWNASVPNPSPDYAFTLHGPDAGAASWVNRQPNGSWRAGSDAWFDPAIPEAADYMAKSVVSLARAYPLDGLQLDRIRYPDGGDWGYSPVTLARYQQETGAKGVPAPADPLWKAWKREQVTALVRRVALEARATRPGLFMSAATITYSDAPGSIEGFRQTRTYADVLQNWVGWMQEGLLDVNVMMNYKREGSGDQSAWYDHWNTFGAMVRPPGSEVASGTAMYLNTPAATALQAQKAVVTGLGWVGYSDRTPTSAVNAGTQTQPAGLAEVAAALKAPGGVLASAQPWPYLPPTRIALLGRVVGTARPGGQVVEVYTPDGRLVTRATTDANGYWGVTALETELSGMKLEARVGDQRWAETVAPGVTRYPNLFLRTLTPAAR